MGHRPSGLPQIQENLVITDKGAQIRMIPMYHWLPHRIESHVKICVLVLLIEPAAEIKRGMPWSRITQVLRKIQATEFTASSHGSFQLNELPPGGENDTESDGNCPTLHGFWCTTHGKRSCNRVGTREKSRPSLSPAAHGFAPKSKIQTENPSQTLLFGSWAIF